MKFKWMTFEISYEWNMKFKWRTNKEWYCLIVYLLLLSWSQGFRIPAHYENRRKMPLAPDCFRRAPSSTGKSRRRTWPLSWETCFLLWPCGLCSLRCCPPQWLLWSPNSFFTYFLFFPCVLLYLFLVSSPWVFWGGSVIRSIVLLFVFIVVCFVLSCLVFSLKSIFLIAEYSFSFSFGRKNMRI